MAERNILVVASDYEIVQQVRQALHGRGFVIHSTFSHSDTVYSLKQGSQFDVALIDAEMHSRRTGDHTLLMVTELSMRPPLIAIALNGGVDDIGDLQAEQVITTLDEYEIQRVVMHALRIPVITPSHQTRQLNTESPEAREAARRLDEIQTLFSLSRSLTEVLNLSEVLNRVVEAARRLTGAEQGMILLPDEQEPKQLWLRARVGLDIEVARNFRIKDDSNLTKTVFTKGESLLIGAQGPQKIKTEFFVNSLLYVPILLKGSPIGVLGVTNKASHDVFTDVHQELMENLASYAAIAIENARIHEESVKQARELRALVDASNVINSSVSLERTLPNICDQLHLALSVNRIEILKWSPEDDSLRTLTRYFRAATRATDIAAVDLRQRPAMRATLEHNECVWAARSGSQVMGETDALEATGAGATLVLPIFISNHPLGVVQAYYVDPLNQPPSTEVLEQAQLLGLQALTGIANADSTHAAKNSRRLGYDINGLLGSDWCECALLSKDKQSLAIRIMAGQAVWLTPPYPSLDVQDYPLLQRAIQKQDPFYLQQGDTILQNGSEKLLSYTQSRALLCIPLVNRGQSQGMVLLGDAERSRVFNDHEIELARAITGQAAMALENAQLVHDLEASLIELKETQGR
jgi:GAF domain-containing protein